MSQARFDVVIDLHDADIAWQPLHEALEDLEAAGFFPHRYHVVPEQQLARIDAALSGTFGTEMSGGGAWVIERMSSEGESPVVGCAGYRGDGENGIAGPFSLEGDVAVHRMTILIGTLFSLRERGYRFAHLHDVKESAVPALVDRFGTSLTVEPCRNAQVKPRVVVCASGSGSNFQAVINAVASDILPLDLVGLVVNKANAFALQRAEAAGIPAHALIWDRAAENRDAFDQRVLTQVKLLQPDLVLLLGWMHLLPSQFVAAFPELCNIHPAYLPLDPSRDEVVLPDGSVQAAFRGARAVDDALAAGSPWIGASFHRVTAETDRGAILARAPLAVHASESREQLTERLHTLEHRVMIDALSAWQKRYIRI